MLFKYSGKYVNIHFNMKMTCLCRLLVSLFLNDCGFTFLSRTWPSGCSVLTCMSVMFEEFLFVIS